MLNDLEIAKEVKEKPHKVQQWEINAIGCFLLDLYHRQVISMRADWLVRKYELRTEFQKFLQLEENCNLRVKFEQVNGGKCDIGSLLFRTRYLINTPRGSDLYRIKNAMLFKYRNEKLDEYDERRQNGTTLYQKQTEATSVESQLSTGTAFDPALAASLQVDEDAPSHPLNYEGSQIQKRDAEFQMTSMGCYICQRNFVTPDEFEEHVEDHGDESDFKLQTDLIKYGRSILNLSYSICKNSHYFCFKMDSAWQDIVIEKIIIVQTRSFYYVNNALLPYALSAEQQNTFFVDSHLFRMFLEQPVVIIFHKVSNHEIRIVEQHHFIRIEDFPAVKMSLNPNRLPNKLLFKRKFELPRYLPPSDVRAALKRDPIEEQLCRMSNEFRDYLSRDKTLTQQNVREVLTMLLQVEDVDTMREYYYLIQRNVKLRQFCREYILKVKSPKNIAVENVIVPFDEVIIMPENTVDLSQPMETLITTIDELIDKVPKEKKKKIYYGQVDRISNGRVTFVCDRKIPEMQSYTIMFRPTRLTLRYQYRALEQLTALPGSTVGRFLFPQCTPSPDLSNFRLHLDLLNKNIYGNPEQLQAVQNVVNNAGKEAPYIIFGPPGTGKTTTIVEAILQVYQLQPGSRILIMAGSNSACDEIALRLCKILSTMSQQMHAIARIYSRSNEKRYDNIDELLLEHSNMYATHFYPHVDVLHQYRIIVCTLTVVGKLAMGKFGKDALGEGIFTHVFVDEVAASTETETLVGIMNTLNASTNLIISGDHKQLGPILNSTRAEELGLGVSMMERLLARDCYRVDADGNYNRSIQTRLCRNFRSHPEIVQLYSRLYYRNELKAVTTNDVESLCRNWHRSPNPHYPIIFHSVFGTSQREGNSTSLYNPLELQVLMDYVKDLMYFGVNGQKIEQSDIGIISPYKKQYLRIQEELNLRNWYYIETGAVETFQGREKAIIIVSFVRSFTSNLGFLENPRRINVTLSRAKSLLILIGNPKTLSMNQDFKYIINECKAHNTMVGATYYDLLDGVSAADSEDVGGVQIGKLAKSMEKLSLSNENVTPFAADVDAGQPKKKKWKKKNNTTSNGTKNTSSNTGPSTINNNSSSENQVKKNSNAFKHVKPTSDEKQRKTFAMYKDLFEAMTESAGEIAQTTFDKKSEIDALFDELPNVPQAYQKLATSTNDTLCELNSLAKIHTQLQGRIENLRLKALSSNASSRVVEVLQPTTSAQRNGEAVAQKATSAERPYRPQPTSSGVPATIALHPTCVAPKITSQRPNYIAPAKISQCTTNIVPNTTTQQPCTFAKRSAANSEAVAQKAASAERPYRPQPISSGVPATIAQHPTCVAPKITSQRPNYHQPVRNMGQHRENYYFPSNKTSSQTPNKSKSKCIIA